MALVGWTAEKYSKLSLMSVHLLNQRVGEMPSGTAEVKWGDNCDTQCTSINYTFFYF